MRFDPTVPTCLRRAGFAAAFVAVPAVAANALELFFDDFDEITTSQLNFTGLDNFTVTDGSVDAFVNGGFGLLCPSLGCLDLDGSTLAAGRIESNTVFAFEGGKTYKLELNLSGNQRGAADDFLTFGITGFGSSGFPSGATDPFEPRGLTFSSGAAFSGRLFVENGGGDNYGAILDSVRLIEVEEGNGDPGVVPLPATLPLVVGALGLFGLVRRRG